MMGPHWGGGMMGPHWGGMMGPHGGGMMGPHWGRYDGPHLGRGQIFTYVNMEKNVYKSAGKASSPNSRELCESTCNAD